MPYYQRIRDLREDKDLKQKDIADLLETSSNYYGDYENGKRDITFERAIKLSEFYNVSLDYIAGRTDDKRGIGYSKEEIEDNRKNKCEKALKKITQAVNEIKEINNIKE